MKQVVMIGPSPASRGGMASVIATLLEHGYADGAACRFIATQVDGGPLRKAGRALGALLEFGLLLARGKVALLHVHVASGLSFWRKAVFIWLAQLFRCPVLFHLHGGEFCEFVEHRLSGWRQRLALATVARSACAFALTGASAAWLRERAGVASVEVFPNPIARAAPLPRSPSHEVLFLGRLEEKKGVFDLLHSFPQVLAGCPAARLVLAGDGERAPVQALARALGVAHALVLPGWVDPAGRAALLSRAAVFVLPSYYEQMPISVLEAMAAGVPVVASNVGALPEMLAYGKCGVVVSCGDIAGISAQVLRILNDNILAESLSAGGLDRVRSEYVVEIVIERLRRRYKELVR